MQPVIKGNPGKRMQSLRDIENRAGIYDYRHSQYDEVDPGLLGAVDGVELHCPPGAQLMWTSDVRYRDEASLAAFDASPPPEVKPHLLGDIELIVDKSTTYRAVGDNACTYIDHTDDAAPHGPPRFADLRVVPAPTVRPAVVSGMRAVPGRALGKSGWRQAIAHEPVRSSGYGSGAQGRLPDQDPSARTAIPGPDGCRAGPPRGGGRTSRQRCRDRFRPAHQHAARLPGGGPLCQRIWRSPDYRGTARLCRPPGDRSGRSHGT